MSYLKIGKKGVSKQLVQAFTIPLIIMILLAVYVTFQDQTKTVFEQSIVNETVGTGAGASYTTDYHAKKNTTVSGLTIFNGTEECDNCTISFTPGGVLTITTGYETGGMINVSYVAYSKSGYSSFTSINTGTESGFNLASMLPYVIIALTILALMLKYLGVI